MSKPKNSASAAPKPVPAGSRKATPSTRPAPPADDFEPSAIRASAPVWLFVLLMVLIYWSMIHLDDYAGGFNDRVYGPYHSYQELADLQPKSGPEALIAQGQVVYNSLCIACHQSTGLGAPGQAPPLAGSEWAQGPANRVIRIPLQGLTGPIQVKGQTWNLTMPPFGSMPGLGSDESIAAVLTFVRQAFGNKADPITPAQVKAVRAEIAAHSSSWTADELLKVQ